MTGLDLLRPRGKAFEAKISARIGEARWAAFGLDERPCNGSARLVGHMPFDGNATLQHELHGSRFAPCLHGDLHALRSKTFRPRLHLDLLGRQDPLEKEPSR